MATISTSNISQKWADNGYWNAETNDKTIYAGYATGSKINYVTRIRILMPGNGVSAQVKIAYKHDGSLNGKQLKYKVVKTEQDATYGKANASTPGDGNLTIAASSGFFVIDYTGSFSAGEYLYIYLWTAGSTSVYTLCNIQATSKHSATYTEGTASSISVAGSAIGSPVSFTINSNNAGFSHTLTVSFGTYTSTIADRSTQKSFSWAPPLSTFAAFIPNGTAITGTVTLSTYNGSTFIGSNTYDLTLNLPASVVPTLDKSKVSITNVSDNSAVQAWGLLVQNYSRAKAVLQSGAASGVFGSTIAKTELIYAGQAFTSLQTGILTAAGTFDFTVRVTDSRGRTASVTFSAYVYPYSEPYFLSYEVYRCNASGTPSEDGMYIYAYASVTWSSLNNNNKYDISLRYESSDKLVQGSASLSNGIQEIVSAGLSSRTTYRVTIEVKDSLGKGTTVSVVIPTTEEVDFVIAPRHMKRAALFKYPERDGFDVPAPIYADQLFVGGISGENVFRVEVTGEGVFVYVQLPDGTKEWLNPPMSIGVEYRTTERYNGQPVYAKLVNVGTLPNNGYKDVYNLASGVKTLVSASLTVNNTSTGATFTGLRMVEISYWYVGSYGDPYFVVQTTGDLTNCEGLVLLKYTKT